MVYRHKEDEAGSIGFGKSASNGPIGFGMESGISGSDQSAYTHNRQAIQKHHQDQRQHEHARTQEQQAHMDAARRQNRAHAQNIGRTIVPQLYGQDPDVAYQAKLFLDNFAHDHPEIYQEFDAEIHTGHQAYHDGISGYFGKEDPKLVGMRAVQKAYDAMYRRSGQLMQFEQTKNDLMSWTKDNPQQVRDRSQAIMDETLTKVPPGQRAAFQQGQKDINALTDTVTGLSPISGMAYGMHKILSDPKLDEDSRVLSAGQEMANAILRNPLSKKINTRVKSAIKSKGGQPIYDNAVQNGMSSAIKAGGDQAANWGNTLREEERKDRMR